MICCECHRTFRSQAAYDLYIRRKELHEQLRLEVYGQKPEPVITYSGAEPSKRERHLEDSQRHRMGQA